MAEWRRQGLCFNCNEKYSRGHNRFYKRIFFLESVEIDDDALFAFDTVEDVVGFVEDRICERGESL